MSARPLIIALAGHANVGKTSLVSALTRDASLDVAEEAGTTTTHYLKTFAIAGEPVLSFVDTPGFVYAGRINRWLDAKGGTGAERLDGRTVIEAFLADPSIDPRHAAEKEALRGALAADVIAYVADVATSPEGQKVQEIRLLRRAGVPVLGVLNNLHTGSAAPEEWSAALNREGIDAIVLLDAMRFPADQERAFYDALRVVRPTYAATFDRIAALRTTLSDQNVRRAALIIAELLVDTLSYRSVTTHPSEDEAKRYRSMANNRFKEDLRRREQACQRELAELYGHGAATIGGASLEVQSSSGEIVEDLFDAEAIRRYGVSSATLGAVGAVTGSAVDVALGGTTLGLGTAIGGGLGLALGLVVGRRVSTKVSDGTLTVGPVDSVQFPSVLLNRAVELWRQLASRSHADRRGVQVLGTDPVRLGPVAVSALNRQARRCARSPDWSRIAAGSLPPERGEAVTALAEVSLELLRAQLDAPEPR